MSTITTVRENINEQIGQTLAQKALCDERLQGLRATLAGFDAAVQADAADEKLLAEGIEKALSEKE